VTKDEQQPTAPPPEGTELPEGTEYDADGRVISAPIPPELWERIRAEQAEAARARAVIDRAIARASAAPVTPKPATAPAPRKTRKPQNRPQTDRARRAIDQVFPDGVPTEVSTTTVTGKIEAVLPAPHPSWKTVAIALGRLPRK
jgi:hypothetical protein